MNEESGAASQETDWKRMKLGMIAKLKIGARPGMAADNPPPAPRVGGKDETAQRLQIEA